MNLLSNRAFWQVRLSTLIMFTVASGTAMLFNYLVRSPEVAPMFEFGFPIPGYSRDAWYPGNLALKVPYHLAVNITLNAAFVLGCTIAWEVSARRKEAFKRLVPPMPRPQISLAALLVAVLTAGVLWPLVLAICFETDELAMMPGAAGILRGAAVLTWAVAVVIIGWLAERYVRAKALARQPPKVHEMRFRTRVIAALRPGTIRIWVGIGDGLADGGWENDVPAALIPRHLQAPNSEFYVAYGPNHEMIITRLDAAAPEQP